MLLQVFVCNRKECMEDTNLLQMPTFSPKAIFAELKKVRWPSFKGLMSTSGLVLIFTFLFGVYFFLCELAASGLVSWIVSL